MRLDICASFVLEQVAQAHALLDANRQIGKVVLTLDPELADRFRIETRRAYAPVTRQITSPTSSATSSEPSGPSVTPTGRP